MHQNKTISWATHSTICGCVLWCLSFDGALLSFTWFSSGYRLLVVSFCINTIAIPFVPSDDFIFNPLEIHWTSQFFFHSIALLKIWQQYIWKVLKRRPVLQSNALGRWIYLTEFGTVFAVQQQSGCLLSVYESVLVRFANSQIQFWMKFYFDFYIQFIRMENHAKSRSVHSFGFQHPHHDR